MYGIGTWLASWDSFGLWAKFNYRGESGFGTSYGGFCSLIVTIVTAFFVIVQIYSFLFNTNYNQSDTQLFLTGGDGGYIIQPGDFLPSFAIFTQLPGAEIKWNDSETYEFYFEQVTNSFEEGVPDTYVKYDAIPCSAYIDGPYWNEYSEIEKQDVKD